MSKKKRNPDINFLVQYLRDCCVANVDATFVEMNKLISDNVQTSGRWKLNKAILIVQKEYGFIMESIACIGYRVVPSASVSSYVSRKRLSKVRSQTGMWENELDNSTRGKPLTMADLTAYSQVALVKVVIDEKTQDAVKALVEDKPIDWRLEHEKTRQLLRSIAS